MITTVENQLDKSIIFKEEVIPENDKKELDYLTLELNNLISNKSTRYIPDLIKIYFQDREYHIVFNYNTNKYEVEENNDRT